MAENKIYIKIWNPDTNEDELREFNTDEIDELMESEIIDTDSLGWAMNDQAAFGKVVEMMEGKAFTYKEFVDNYLALTDSKIVIE